jgi:hypothetical protein
MAGGRPQKVTFLEEPSRGPSLCHRNARCCRFAAGVFDGGTSISIAEGGQGARVLASGSIPLGGDLLDSRMNETRSLPSSASGAISLDRLPPLPTCSPAFAAGRPSSKPTSRTCRADPPRSRDRPAGPACRAGDLVTRNSASSFRSVEAANMAPHAAITE